MIHQEINGSFSSYRRTVFPFHSKNQLLSATIETNLRYRKNDIPYLLLIHGSSGIGQDILDLTQLALANSYDVITIDHFTGRQIDKLFLDGTDDNPIEYFDFYQDTISFIESYSPLKSPHTLSVMGLSLGASTAMLLNSPAIEKTYALYPTLRPLSDSLTEIDTRNLSVYTGNKDQWTPLKDAQYLNSLLSRPFDLYPMKDAHHSFMKNGMNASVPVVALGSHTEWSEKRVSDVEYSNLFRQNLLKIRSTDPLIKLKYCPLAYKEVTSSFFAKV